MVKLDSVNKLLLKSILYSEEALQTNFKFHHWAIYLLPCTSGEKKGKERKEKKEKKKWKQFLWTTTKEFHQMYKWTLIKEHLWQLSVKVP